MSYRIQKKLVIILSSSEYVDSFDFLEYITKINVVATMIKL